MGWWQTLERQEINEIEDRANRGLSPLFLGGNLETWYERLAPLNRPGRTHEDRASPAPPSPRSMTASRSGWPKTLF